MVKSIDAVVLGMGANELHEGYLPAEIESDHQAVVSSRNFAATELAFKSLKRGNGSLGNSGVVREIGLEELAPLLCFDLHALKREFAGIDDLRAENWLR